MRLVSGDTARQTSGRHVHAGRADPVLSRWLLGALAVFGGFLPLLLVVPRRVSPPADVVSAATVAGYDTPAAWAVAAGWIILTTLAIALIARRSMPLHRDEADTAATDGPASDDHASGGRHDRDRAGGTADDRRVLRPLTGRAPPLLLVGVFILLLLVYFPPFLAKSGPFIEDQIHLGALHRMIGGQMPYRDFEFLYGPLMLYVPWVWTKVFGYDLMAFYSFIALLEAVSFTILTAIVWRLVRDPRRRVFVLVVVAALAFNALVGPNWSVSRRLPALLALIALAADPLAFRNLAGAAALLAVQAAWSHDFGAAGMIGAMAILGLAGLHVSWRRAIGSAIGLAAGTAVLWAAIVSSLLGSAFGDYLHEVRFLTSRFSAGEAGFEFYWTANSLAMFLLIAVACVVVGRRLLSRRGPAPIIGDYLLAGAFAFLVITLRSGLNRSDLWHLDAALLPLMLAVLAPTSRRLFTATKIEDRVMIGASAIVAFTYAFGLLPSASFLARGWLRGMRNVAAATAAPAFRPRAPALILGRRSHDTPAWRMAEYFSDPQRATRPIAFYEDTWPLPKFIGVYKTDFINDDFLYSDSRGDRVRDYLDSHPDAFVVITEDAYNRLAGLSDSTAFPELRRRFQPTVVKRLGGWLSTVHYRGVEAEIAIKDARWRRTVGAYVKARYRVVERFDSFLVLGRTGG